MEVIHNKFSLLYEHMRCTPTSSLHNFPRKGHHLPVVIEVTPDALSIVQVNHG